MVWSCAIFCQNIRMMVSNPQPMICTFIIRYFGSVYNLNVIRYPRHAILFGKIFITSAFSSELQFYSVIFHYIAICITKYYICWT